jgi:hypothetical protein
VGVAVGEMVGETVGVASGGAVGLRSGSAVTGLVIGAGVLPQAAVTSATTTSVHNPTDRRHRRTCGRQEDAGRVPHLSCVQRDISLSFHSLTVPCKRAAKSSLQAEQPVPRRRCKTRSRLPAGKVLPARGRLCMRCAGTPQSCDGCDAGCKARMSGLCRHCTIVR